jgi:hypothetical protein
MTLQSCDCSVDIDDCGASCSSTFVRKARKPHTCCECGEVIPVGKKYQEDTGIYDGRAFRYRTCIGCAAIRQHYCPSGWYWGELRNQILECLGFDYTDAPSEITDDEGPSLYNRDHANAAYP